MECEGESPAAGRIRRRGWVGASGQRHIAQSSIPGVYLVEKRSRKERE